MIPSASKACAELITESFRKSFTNKKNNKLLIASARAGNVLGGGDWTNDRIFKDIAISISKNKKLSLRNPNSVRPWQHVLEPLSGYLLLGQLLFQDKKEIGFLGSNANGFCLAYTNREFASNHYEVKHDELVNISA